MLQDGQPYKFADGETMTITFLSTEGKGSVPATVAKDGSFTVQDPGLPAGAYKVVVNSNLAGGGYVDKLGGAFSEANTPLKVDIPAGNAAPVVEIDLGKKTVTVK